jgi:hypothetical protein
MFLSAMHLINVNTPHTFIISIHAVAGRVAFINAHGAARFAHLRRAKTRREKHTRDARPNSAAFA